MMWRRLERRAIENYCTDEAVKKAKGPRYRALQPYGKLNDMDPTWGKRDNWRIAREMSRSALERTNLGKFLACLLVAKLGPTLRIAP